MSDKRFFQRRVLKAETLILATTKPIKQKDQLINQIMFSLHLIHNCHSTLMRMWSQNQKIKLF